MFTFHQLRSKLVSELCRHDYMLLGVLFKETPENIEKNLNELKDNYSYRPFYSGVKFCLLLVSLSFFFGIRYEYFHTSPIKLQLFVLHIYLLIKFCINYEEYKIIDKLNLKKIELEKRYMAGWMRCYGIHNQVENLRSSQNHHTSNYITMVEVMSFCGGFLLCLMYWVILIKP
jgi:hypothetical protein